MSRTSESDKIEYVSKSASNVVRYATLAEYIQASGLLKHRVAETLGIDRIKFSTLLKPKYYRPRVDDELAARIAKLLNQSITHVRRLYPEPRTKGGKP